MDNPLPPLFVDCPLKKYFFATSLSESAISELILDSLSINTSLGSRFDLTPCEKLRTFFEQEVLMSGKTYMADKSSSEDGLDSEDSSGIEDLSSKEAEVGCGSAEDIALSVSCPDNVQVNVTEDLVSILSDLLDGKCTARWGRGKAKGSERISITNKLGTNMEAEYSIIQNGKSRVLSRFEENLAVEDTTSSEDEEHYDDLLLPWSRLINITAGKFHGFEDCLKADLDELTKLISLHSFTLVVDGFEPVSMLLPRSTCCATVQLTAKKDDDDNKAFTANDTVSARITSVVDGSVQEICISSTSQLRNLTDQSLIIYADSEDENWKKSMNCSVENPFDSLVKLKEMLPGDTYSMPLFLSSQAKLYVKPADNKYNTSLEYIDLAGTELEDFVILSSTSNMSLPTILLKASFFTEDDQTGFTIEPFWRLVNNLPFKLSLFTQVSQDSKLFCIIVFVDLVISLGKPQKKVFFQCKVH